MRLMIKGMLFLFVTILIIMIPSVTFLWQAQQKTILEQAHIRASTIYSIVSVSWKWFIENSNDIKSIPALVTKEVGKYANDDINFKFRVTSERPLNPENKANEFEMNALKHFKLGGKEYAEVAHFDNGSSSYMYAGPLFANQRCIECHDARNSLKYNFGGVISIVIQLDDIEKSISKSNNISFYTIVIGLFSIAIMVSILIYWLIVRHIKTLYNATEVIRQGGRVVTKLNTDDELQDLSEAFDRMSLQLAANEDNLKVRLDEAVKRYVALVKELETKNESLDSINKMKTEILDSISHEVRTPLTKIFSYSELLCDSRVIGDAELRTKFANSLKLNINSLKNMFTDILTLSRLEHEQYTFMILDINLKKMVNEFLTFYEMEIKSKSLKINIDISGEDVLFVDNESFYSAISNIISNAIKYSKKNGVINISAFHNEEKYYIIVQDFGVGIPPEDIKKATVRFYRGSNVKKEFSGTGLGLSIVARVVIAHHGTIDIQSEINKFTKITLTFPIDIINNLKNIEE